MKRAGKFWIPDSDTHFSRWLDKGVPYQERPRTLAIDAATKYRRAVDVGAHVGTWALPLSWVFDAVEAFEPNGQNRECLTANLFATKNTTVHACALGSQEGLATEFVLERTNSGMRGLAYDPKGTVQVRTLDSFGFTDVDLLKIDVEGFGVDVLGGAKDTIRTCQPAIALEDMDGAARALLADWGYRIEWSVRDNHVLVPDG